VNVVLAVNVLLSVECKWCRLFLVILLGEEKLVLCAVLCSGYFLISQ
jgi:hypothetical protein